MYPTPAILTNFWQQFRRHRPTSLLFAFAFFALFSQPTRLDAQEAKKTPSHPLLIVAPKALEPALRDYLDFKKKILPTTIVTLEQILADTPGADDPEKLKRFIYDDWKKSHLGYVLLVGDRDIMPVRYMTSLKFSTFDYLFVPTDLYYADLQKEDGTFDDWNADKSTFHKNYFGEITGEKGRRVSVDEIRYHPEIAVGRWPVSTPDSVRLLAQKSMTYEKSIRDGTHPGLHRAAIFHVQGWIDARDDLVTLAHSLYPGLRTETFLFQDDNPKFTSPVASEDRMIAELNKGLALCIHAGHGEADSWLDYPMRTGTHLNNIFSTYHTLPLVNNADRLPVMISIGCSTAYFSPLIPDEPFIDIEGKSHPGQTKKEVFNGPPPAPSPYQTGKLVHESMGKQLLENGSNGAVAYIGSDMVAQNPGLVLLDGFIDALRQSHDPHLGDCWSSAVNYYYEKQNIAKLKNDGDWVIPAIFMQPMKFNLFGDPSLPLAPAEAPAKPKSP